MGFLDLGVRTLEILILQTALAVAWIGPIRRA